MRSNPYLWLDRQILGLRDGAFILYYMSNSCLHKSFIVIAHKLVGFVAIRTITVLSALERSLLWFELHGRSAPYQSQCIFDK